MYFCTAYNKTVATALLKVLTQWGSHIVVAMKATWELYNNKAWAPPEAGRREAVCMSVVLKAPQMIPTLRQNSCSQSKMGNSRHHAEI